jgi:hypothetical protein
MDLKDYRRKRERGEVVSYADGTAGRLNHSGHVQA